MAHRGCPSVRELLDGVKSLTQQSDGTFQTAWSNSFIDPSHCCEQGGFIYVEFPVPSKVSRAWITKAPKGVTMNQRTQGPNAAIDLNKPGIQMNNVILAANFHTHPLSSNVGGDLQPSRADTTNAYARGVPGIVISRDGIYSYGPESRASVNNPKGYPGAATAPDGIHPVHLERRPPPPWAAKNQWPEGTAKAMAGVFVENQATANSNASDCDVIYVEWSDKDVVYGEGLAESEGSIEIRSEGDE